MPDIFVCHNTVITNSKLKELQRVANLDANRKTYGLDLVDNDTRKISERKITTISIDQPESGFSDNLIKKN